jgi:hypothetical protein
MGTPVGPEAVFTFTTPPFLQWALSIAQDWFMRLGHVALQGREEWLRQIQCVEEECMHTRERSPLQGELDAESAERAAAEILSLIENFYKTSFNFHHTLDEKLSIICVCRSILQALLPPGLTRWDISCVNSDFMKELMVLSFSDLASIKCLKVDTEAFSTSSWLLLNNIRLLRELQELTFPTGCYRQILAEVGTYCPKIKMLDINSSKCVDDASIIHLLKLKDLLYLNIDDTSISAKAYGNVLSELPNVQNISWSTPADDVLENVTKDRLISVKLVMGTIRKALMLVEKCPFITTLSLLDARRNLSDLKDLAALTDLAIMKCNYHTVDLFSVLESVGPRLKRLHLSLVHGVSVCAVTQLCMHLETLEFIECKFSDSVYLFDSELLHFKNLAFLTLDGNGYFGNFHYYLSCCVHLSTFTARNTTQLDDAALFFIVMNKGFQELNVFSAHHCGPLSIKSAVLLIEKCRNLTELRGVGTWSRINKEEDMPNLLPIVMEANVHVTED